MRSAIPYHFSMKTLIVFCLSMLAIQAMGQKEKSLLREGNKAYEKGEFETASERYNESLEIDGSYGKASFNLGNAQYRSGALGEASKQYEVAAADAIDPADKAKAYHNVGNSFLNAARMLIENPPEPNDSVQPPDPQQLIKASIEAYKKALRNAPEDEESRYNLAYAQKMLSKDGGGGGGQDEQQQEQEQDQEQDEEQDDEKEGGDKEQEKKEGEDGEDGKENEKNDQGDQEQDQGEQEPKDDQMSKEEAEQLLKALDQNEKDLQKKLGKERAKGEKIKIDKDW